MVQYLRLRMAAHLSIDDLDVVDAGTTTRDAQNRIIQVIANYPSVKATYDISWIGSTIEVSGMAVPTIQDLP